MTKQQEIGKRKSCATITTTTSKDNAQEEFHLVKMHTKIEIFLSLGL
jgi:hypothetical protein